MEESLHHFSLHSIADQVVLDSTTSQDRLCERKAKSLLLLSGEESLFIERNPGKSVESAPTSDMRFTATCSCASSTEQFHIDERSDITRFMHQGISGPFAVDTNGPSVSVSTRSFGIAATRERPFLVDSMAGPTLNQHPKFMAILTSRIVPENQWRTGVLR
uniref:Uncharacterized protein n=1 Tax=Candidatus Kentrum sp. UNK TaxID=2126344 RepID=A0A451A831_9GAMM|nr:MAG: hypothetical protein BECKUNK1418G_GA0071005_102230 [Candidatus Kentron sp. UNK]VFK70309.1 MAG: hypothetical protein BECKUNK1418H_GA0071006_102628 [Candidatus Kentron sp. UNK]